MDGYSGQDVWGYYGGTNASHNSYGPHNCTLYAAYRLSQEGVAKPGWYGNADQWADLAYNKQHIVVNQKQAVGAIAQWNGGSFGHVAYVESVNSSGILITEDNYYYGTAAPNGGYTARIQINYGSPAWPDNFIHYVPDSNPIAEALNADGRLEAFGVNTHQPDGQNDVYHAWQNSPGGSWSTWHTLAGYLA